jgi:hypothetical protein
MFRAAAQRDRPPSQCGTPAQPPPCLQETLNTILPQVYPDPVRVVAIGRSVDQLLQDPAAPSNADYSVEFCGGTHLADTSGVFSCDACNH